MTSDAPTVAVVACEEETDTVAPGAEVVDRIDPLLLPDVVELADALDAAAEVATVAVELAVVEPLVDALVVVDSCVVVLTAAAALPEDEDAALVAPAVVAVVPPVVVLSAGFSAVAADLAGGAAATRICVGVGM